MLSKLANSRSCSPITPSATPMNQRPNGIYVGATGNIVCKFIEGGPDVTFVAVPAGTILPISPIVVSAGSSLIGM